MVKDTARVNPLRLYMRTQLRNGFTSSHTTHPIHATGNRLNCQLKSRSSRSPLIRVESSRERSQKSSRSAIVLDRSCSSTRSISGSMQRATEMGITVRYGYGASIGSLVWALPKQKSDRKGAVDRGEGDGGHLT